MHDILKGLRKKWRVKKRLESTRIFKTNNCKIIFQHAYDNSVRIAIGN